MRQERLPKPSVNVLAPQHGCSFPSQSWTGAALPVAQHSRERGAEDHGHAPQGLDAGHSSVCSTGLVAAGQPEQSTHHPLPCAAMLVTSAFLELFSLLFYFFSFPLFTQSAAVFTAHYTTNPYFMSPTGPSCPHSLLLPDKLIRWKAPWRPRASEHYHLEARQKY